MSDDTSAIRLTETVQKGGCAAKLPASSLREALGALKLPRPKELLVGLETLDDACLWDLGDGRLMIKTLDFFTPIVDDAEEFGSIAAANALSDVYAMGGDPALALTILAFPTAHLPLSLLAPLMKGAVDTISASGAALGGGHSIDDDTLKLGFSVTGFVQKGREWTNAGARPTDVLILTKALGTGTITSALKRREADGDHVRAAIASMRQLNRVQPLLASLIAQGAIHAATDVTGFGLAGHAVQMAEASGVSIAFDCAALPALPGAKDYLARGVVNRAHRTNTEYVSSRVVYDASCSEVDRLLTVDPQTSGGLLLCVAKEHAEACVVALQREFQAVAMIGLVAERGDVKLRFRG